MPTDETTDPVTPPAPETDPAPEPPTLEALAANVHAAFDDARQKNSVKIAADAAAVDAGIALESARTALKDAKAALIDAVNATTV